MFGRSVPVFRTKSFGRTDASLQSRVTRGKRRFALQRKQHTEHRTNHSLLTRYSSSIVSLKCAASIMSLEYFDCCTSAQNQTTSHRQKYKAIALPYSGIVLSEVQVMKRRLHIIVFANKRFDRMTLRASALSGFCSENENLHVHSFSAIESSASFLAAVTCTGPYARASGIFKHLCLMISVIVVDFPVPGGP